MFISLIAKRNEPKKCTGCRRTANAAIGGKDGVSKIGSAALDIIVSDIIAKYER